MRIPKIIHVAASLLLLAACTEKTVIEFVDDPEYHSRIKTILSRNDNFSVFNKYFSRWAPAMLDSLAGTKEYTIMVPENAAFRNMLLDVFSSDSLMMKKELNNFSSYILTGKQSLRLLPMGDEQELTCLNGNKVMVSKWMNGADTVISVNGCIIKNPDMVVSNGFINVMTSCYPPAMTSNIMQTIESDYGWTYFVAALHHTGLDDLLSGTGVYTVIAPDNKAFNHAGFPDIQSIIQTDPAALRERMETHILPGRMYEPHLQGRLASATDTLQLQALNQTTVKVYFQPKGSWDLSRYYASFIGEGDIPYDREYRVFDFTRRLPFASNGIVYGSRIVLHP